VLERCTLPLTAVGAVHRVITDLCVLDVEPGRGLILRELAPGVTADEVQAATEPRLIIDGPPVTMTL
jgi:3-oxoacid CoA-transferase subunit B